MEVYVNERLEELELGQALGEISPARRAYALRYRNALDRKLSVAVYLLLKKGLRERYGIDENPVLATGPNGKPFLLDHPGIHFSFSHCPKAAACAISSRPVGVDVEAVSPVDWDVANGVLSPEELTALRQSPRPDALFAIFWTRREALVKLRGEALDESRLQGLLAEVSPESIKTREGPGYVLSVAGAEGLDAF